MLETTIGLLGGIGKIKQGLVLCIEDPSDLHRLKKDTFRLPKNHLTGFALVYACNHLRRDLSGLAAGNSAVAWIGDTEFGSNRGDVASYAGYLLVFQSGDVDVFERENT